MLFLTARPPKVSQPVSANEEQKSVLSSDPSATIPSVCLIPSEPLKQEDKPIYSTSAILEKAAFIPPKQISHSPKISPSSIPNPNPSITTTKQVESGYSNYSGFMYSVPGYSAFQPVAYPGVVQPTTVSLPQNENAGSEFNTRTLPPKEYTQITSEEEKQRDLKQSENIIPQNISKMKTDFQENVTAEMISAVPDTSDVKKIYDSKTGAVSTPQVSNSLSVAAQDKSLETNKKPSERFSLKTSIPISKIDMKCVNNSNDTIFQSTLANKTFNPAFHTPFKEVANKVEIQSNIVIKSAPRELEQKDTYIPVPNNSISTLINAAEAINKTEAELEKPDSKLQDSPFSIVTASSGSVSHHPIFNPLSIETSKSNAQTKTTDSSLREQKSQIVFIQNKNQTNQKMLLTIQQPNPQVLLQRTNFDSKNLQAPSRPSKKCKEELINENGTSSNVVSLKRLHQENCDENDFENLITENQIYGNKIVVKEKSQGTLQEQDLKNKHDKPNQSESKNMILQPNFLYLSNVQFPANLMMVKNGTKVPNDTNKVKNSSNDATSDINSQNINDNTIRNKLNNIPVNKEMHVIKSNSNVLQSLSNKNGKQDLVFQNSNQPVLVNPQIVYQMPMIVEADNKLNAPFVNTDFTKIVAHNKKELQKPLEQNKNDKLFIACPYQMDAKLQPKIVITNLRPKVSIAEEVSSLDIYEKRKRLRRLKYLSNREIKQSQNLEIPKSESKKIPDNYRNIITPDKMKGEIYKELTTTKVKICDESSGDDSDYGEEEIEEYISIIKEYGNSKQSRETQENSDKIEFLANFKLASQNDYNEKLLDRQERILKRDSVASAYIAAGRLDCLTNSMPLKASTPKPEKRDKNNVKEIKTICNEDNMDQKLKQRFLCSLSLIQVTTRYQRDYETAWQEIVKERKRRGQRVEAGPALKSQKLQKDMTDLDTSGQLKILTEIKKHVTDNNKLIIKRFDSHCDNGESIKVLAEKNFSELNRLSKMADRCVKHFSGQDTRKRDLNPGFDSENIQNPCTFYPNINIPNISKIISLKTEQLPCAALTTPATSMDEPQNSAAGLQQLCDASISQDFSCQVDETSYWPGVDSIIKSYKDYDLVRKREIVDFHKRNTALRVESAHITRAASRDSDRARALLAERRHLASEERAVRTSIQWLHSVIEAVRNYDERLC